MNSVDVILARAPSRDKIINKLTKNYQERIAITRLVNVAMEQIQSGGNLSFEQKNNISTWYVGTVVLDLNAATGDDPSFFGLISHVFRLCFDEEYAQVFEDAVNSIGDAYESFFVQQQKKLVDAANLKELLGYRAGMVKISKRIEVIRPELIEKHNEIVSGLDVIRALIDAFNQFEMKRSMLLNRVERLNELSSELRYFYSTDILREFAEIVCDCKLEKYSAEEKEMLDKILSTEQREALVEEFSRSLKPEIEMLQEQIETKVRQLKVTIEYYEELGAQRDDLLKVYDILKERSAFFVQEMARLEALIP